MAFGEQKRRFGSRRPVDTKSCIRGKEKEKQRQNVKGSARGARSERGTNRSSVCKGKKFLESQTQNPGTQKERSTKNEKEVCGGKTRIGCLIRNVHARIQGRAGVQLESGSG